MPFKNSGRHVQQYVYDAAVDSKVSGANIVLSAKAGYDPLPLGAIVTGVTAFVNTAVAGTSSTVSWGHSANADGFSGTTIAEATLTTGYVENGWKTANSDLWDDTNDVQKYHYVSTADLGSFVVLISTADLTAGKITFMVDYLLPS
jgi:hypothetical protein